MNTPTKHTSWLAMAVVVVLGALLGWAILQKDQPKASDEHGHAEHAGHKEHEEHKEGHEHADDDHHEDAAQAKPAKSPQVEQPSPAGNLGPEVTLSDAQLQQAGVVLAVAGPASIHSQLALLGEVRYNGDRTVQVVPRLAGLVEAVPVSAGELVRKGQVLAVLSSPALADQRAEGLAAQKRLALARTTHDREKTLWQDKISAEQDYLQARGALQEAEIAEQNIRQKLALLGVTAGAAATSGGHLTRFELRSPRDGVVTDKRITVGQSVGESEHAFTISDLSTVWVEAPVATKDLGAIRTGLAVQVKASGFAAQAAGVITYVSALVGEQTRSATARVVLPNPKGLWRPGLPVQVQVQMTTASPEVRVAVQADALQSMGDRQVVFVRHGQQIEARPLALGRSDGRVVEVLSGLSAGEQYAARNSFVIKAELGKAGASHEH